MLSLKRWFLTLYFSLPIVRYLVPKGVGNSTYDVVEVVSACDEPWTIDADAAVMDVSSGSAVSFDVTVRSIILSLTRKPEHADLQLSCTRVDFL